MLVINKILGSAMATALYVQKRRQQRQYVHKHSSSRGSVQCEYRQCSGGSSSNSHSRSSINRGIAAIIAQQPLCSNNCCMHNVLNNSPTAMHFATAQSIPVSCLRRARPFTVVRPYSGHSCLDDNYLHHHQESQHTNGRALWAERAC